MCVTPLGERPGLYNMSVTPLGERPGLYNMSVTPLGERPGAVMSLFWLKKMNVLKLCFFVSAWLCPV